MESIQGDEEKGEGKEAAIGDVAGATAVPANDRPLPSISSNAAGLGNPGEMGEAGPLVGWWGTKI